MPGIAGIISCGPTGEEESQLGAMIQCMLHEPFYTSGRYVNQERGIFVGFVSIRGSFSDCMPVFNEKRTIVLFLTGECYVDDRVLSELRGQGHDVDGSNAGFLVHLYEERRDLFFRDLNGWFNGLLLDMEAGKAFLFNDRYGIRRIYYHETEAGFFFSSESKSLLKILPALRTLKKESVAEFLVYDAILEDKSYFPGVFTLPPASAWIFEKGRPKAERKGYLDVGRLESQVPLGQSEFEEEFIGLFRTILPRYFRGGRIGMSLTGGLDTRLIMAGLNPEAGRLPCYTFGGKYRNIFDVRLAPRVAEICGQDHRTLLLDDEAFLKDYPAHLARSIYVTDGIESVDKTDVIHFNTLAREVAPSECRGSTAARSSRMSWVSRTGRP